MAGSIAVNRARVPRGAATRGDVERWFARVPVERLGLAADEIFYVPRLRMRIPAHAGAANGRIPDLILEALRAQVAAAGLGWRDRFVPGRAYRFASRSRYFAWLVSLWVRDGSAAARDTFTAATGHAALAPWQRETVLRAGPELVATIARLAEIGCAGRWLARFEAADIALAYRAIEAAFALPFSTVMRSAPAASAAAMPESRAVPPRETPPAGAPASAAVFREIVATLTLRGNAWAALPVPARALLLAAAVIARSSARPAREAPALVAAILAFAAWPRSMFETPVAEPELPAAPVAEAAPEARQRLPAETATRRKPGAPTAPPAANVEPPPSAMLPKGKLAPEPPATPPAIETPAEIALTATAAPRFVPAVWARPASPGPLLAPDLCFATGFGGLLFLINAFVALHLYPDFTHPLGRRLDPSPLWLADRIGLCWFGTRYRRDPLAAWIAAHAAPGRLPATWRAEAEWLAGFETPARPRVSHSHGRATLWHSRGFPLLDGKERAPRRQIRSHREAQRLPRLPARDRWAACLALYLDARLRLLAGGGLALLEQPAQIRVRDLALHAGFELARHPIGLRIAGLDRDPGWQPAEGRHFAFAFE